MMGVYIKGMDMPKDGEVICVFSNGKVQKRIVQFSTLYEIIEASTAIPVPDHGRLIDADELKKKHHWTDDFYETEYVEVEDIDAAPTIIPASKGGKIG